MKKYSFSTALWIDFIRYYWTNLDKNNGLNWLCKREERGRDHILSNRWKRFQLSLISTTKAASRLALEAASFC